jgi:hypothetical protein
VGKVAGLSPYFRQVVKSRWYGGQQNIVELAATLHVSPMALRYRLSYLGLLEAPDRCSRQAVRSQASATGFVPAVAGGRA